MLLTLKSICGSAGAGAGSGAALSLASISFRSMKSGRLSFSKSQHCHGPIGKILSRGKKNKNEKDNRKKKKQKQKTKKTQTQTERDRNREPSQPAHTCKRME